MLVYNFVTQKDTCCFNCVNGTQEIDFLEQSDKDEQKPGLKAKHEL